MQPITVTLPRASEMHWAIFGRHHIQDHFIERLHTEGLAKPIVIISPEQVYARDRRLLSNHNLFGKLDQLAEQGLAEVHQFETVNSDECLALLRAKGCNVAFSISCRDIIRKNVIDFFDRRIFNIHDSYLPNERGGALNSWRILNDVRFVGNTIHLVDEGVDTGAIVFQHGITLNKPRPIPLDYDEAQRFCSRIILDQFVDAIVAGRALQARPQEESASLYFPRLYTETNGAIDFDWPADAVERFIRAFSDPYPGAWSFLKGEKIHLHHAEVLQPSGFHPFGNGKIVTVPGDGSVRIIAGGGLIRLGEATLGGTRQAADRVLRIRHTLFTPPEALRDARTVVPVVQKMR